MDNPITNYIYTKKPVDIEAFQINLNDSVLDTVIFPPWLVRAWNTPAETVNSVWIKPGEEGERYLMVTTLEGPLKISDGDYLIQGVMGELYPCKPEIFEMTYVKKYQ